MSDSEEIFSEEEEDNSTIPKKIIKKQRNIFIEDQARVDDDDDEDDEDQSDEEEDGFERESGSNRELNNNTNDSSDRYRALDSTRAKQGRGEEEDAEVIAERLKARYSQRFTNNYNNNEVEYIPQSMLIPSVNDPKLWLVRCKPGSEQGSASPLQILSCFCRDSLRGYVYFEAEKQAHVVQAIERVNNLYGSKLQLVPVGEMVDCLRIKAKESLLVLQQWVRIKRGKLAGDLGQVVDIAESGESVTIKIIPRLDYSRDSSANNSNAINTINNVGGKRKKTGEIRQPQKLFNQNDVNKREVYAQQGGCTYQGDFYDKDGYMEKLVKISALQIKDVVPTLEEITRFSGGVVNDRGEDLSMLAKSNLASGNDFQNGEKVVVLSGEMKNVSGIVISVENGIVTIEPDKSFGLAHAVKYDATELAKRFSEGDHAKVINGVHKGESGLVLKIESNVVTLLSDTSLKPLELFSKDLRRATEVSSITTTTSLYDLHDLIQLSPSEVGVITKMENETYTILDPYGNYSRIKPQQIKSKRDSSRAVTSDINGRPITAGDEVVILDDHGSDKKQATVLHVYRSYVFLTNKNNVLDPVFVARANNVSAVGVKTNNSQPTFQVPSRSFKDHLNSKTVTITGGPFKGYLGIVKDTTETHARVELHTNNRTITIEKERLNVVGEGGRPDYRDEGRGGYDRNSSSGSKSTMHAGSKTPYQDYGSRTPAWNAGSRTPAWNAGSKTPAWDSGSKTPAWDAGGRTPAWDAGAKTPRRFEPSTPFEDSTTTPYASTPAFPSTPTRYASAATPSTPFDVATPMSTPAGKIESSWLTDGILVRVTSESRFSAGKHDDEVFKIVSFDSIYATLTTPTGEVIVPQEYLTPIPPQKRDSFKVLSGEDRGQIGHLLSIDGVEGVVKVDGNDEILMMNMDTLAKLG